MGLVDHIADAGINPTTIIFVLLLCLMIHLMFRMDRGNLPPFPKFRLPIIGHMHYLNLDMRKSFRPLRSKLGNIYSLQLGSKLAIVLSGYNPIKEAFIKQGDVFAERPPLPTMEAVIQGFIGYNGRPWKEHRQFVHSTLKELGMGRRVLETKIQNEATTLVQAVKGMEGQAFNPHDMLTSAVTNVISSVLFGDTFEQGHPLITRILDTIQENARNAPVGGVVNFLPFLRMLPGDPFKMKKLKSNIKKLHQLYGDTVREHRQRSKTQTSDDFISAYLAALDQKNISGEATTLSIGNLGGTIADLFIAGSETTTTVLKWSVLCLVIFPDIQQRLHQDILEHLGENRTPVVADRLLLPYVEAFYMEVLRYCNMSIVLLPHSTSRDTELLGYTIPKEALLLVDIDSIATDPDIWGDPEQFRPERFIDSNGKLATRDEFIFFFFGKRSCLGESMARMELFIILITLVQNFEFLNPANQSLTIEKVGSVFGLTHAPQPYELVARMRQKGEGIPVTKQIKASQ